MLNSDKITTMSGVVIALAIAAGDYFANLGPEGLNWKSPVFWSGLVVALAMAVKGFYTNKPVSK